MNFYVDEKCGNVVLDLYSKGENIGCSGEEIKKLDPNTTDAAGEKHVPVIKQEGNKVVVEVGSVEHPMQEKHFITFVVLETKNGYQVKKLDSSDKPCAEFQLLDGDSVVAAYEYCNLHGLWKTEK